MSVPSEDYSERHRSSSHRALQTAKMEPLSSQVCGAALRCLLRTATRQSVAIRSSPLVPQRSCFEVTVDDMVDEWVGGLGPRSRGQSSFRVCGLAPFRDAGAVIVPRLRR